MVIPSGTAPVSEYGYGIVPAICGFTNAQASLEVDGRRQVYDHFVWMVVNTLFLLDRLRFVLRRLRYRILLPETPLYNADCRWGFCSCRSEHQSRNTESEKYRAISCEALRRSGHMRAWFTRLRAKRQGNQKGWLLLCRSASLFWHLSKFLYNSTISSVSGTCMYMSKHSSQSRLVKTITILS